MKLDKEEQEILDAYDTGKLTLSSPSKMERDKIKTMAERTFRKDRRVTIRLYESHGKGGTLPDPHPRNDSSVRRRRSC